MLKSLNPQWPGQTFKSAQGAGGMDERQGNDLKHLPRTEQMQRHSRRWINDHLDSGFFSKRENTSNQSKNNSVIKCWTLSDLPESQKLASAKYTKSF